MKIVNIVFGILFGLTAILQYNDPDPVLWMVIYGLASLLAFVAYFGNLKNKVIIFSTVLFLIYAATLAPGFYTWVTGSSHADIFGKMTQDKMYVEETREFLGLLICCIIFLLNWNNEKKPI